MEQIHAIFVLAQEPLEEKELSSFLSEMSNKVDVQVIVAIKQLKSKVVNDVEVYYPTMIHQRGFVIDSQDTKLKEHLQQFLLAVTKKDKTIELKEKIHALSKLRDEKVIAFWAQNHEKGGLTSKQSNDFISRISPDMEQNDLLGELAKKKINALHDLNDAKDAAHNLFGPLANLNQCSLRDIYKRLVEQ